MRTKKTEKPVVSNLITDHLDYMIKENLWGVQFVAGRPVMFWGKEYKKTDTPQFTEVLDEQDIFDSLEALGFETDQLTAKAFTYRSDFFPDMRFVIDIVPRSTHWLNRETNVQIRFPRNKRQEINL